MLVDNPSIFQIHINTMDIYGYYIQHKTWWYIFILVYLSPSYEPAWQYLVTLSTIKRGFMKITYEVRWFSRGHLRTCSIRNGACRCGEQSEFDAMGRLKNWSKSRSFHGKILWKKYASWWVISLPVVMEKWMKMARFGMRDLRKQGRFL